MIDKSKYEVVGGITADYFWYGKDNPLETGASIEGRLIGKQERRGDQNSLYFIEDEEGKIGAVWGSTVLDTKLGQIAIGKMVAIEYLGEVPSKVRGRKPYKDFWVGQGILAIGDEGEANLSF